MTILTAIGEEEESGEILETAYELATDLDESLVVLHVVPQQDYVEYKRELERLPASQGYTFSQSEESAGIYAQNSVQHTLGDHDRDRVSTQGRVGEPSAEIIDVAEEIDPRFIVIGGRRRSPVGKAVFGSVTQQVLLNSQWPVVTVMLD